MSPRKRKPRPSPNRSRKGSSPAADLSVSLGPLELPNPVMTASGTFGGLMDRVLNVNRLGAVVEKTITMEPRTGNPHPRVWETPSGMLNSIGLDGPGVEGWIRKRYPQLKGYRCRIMLSVAGRTVEEYGELIRRLDDLTRIDAYELNVSCPNVSRGMDFGTVPAGTARVVRACRAATRRPIFAKLTPNVTDLVAVARAAADAGVDGICAVNTLRGMAIDWRKRAPCLGAVMGGLSGPAIKPVALRAVWEIASALPGFPIVGIGGISTAEDALEFIVAGASAVQVGTASFVDPQAAERIVDDLAGRLGGTPLRELVGAGRV